MGVALNIFFVGGITAEKHKNLQVFKNQNWNEFYMNFWLWRVSVSLLHKGDELQRGDLSSKNVKL